jgi:hypothetical protein
MPLSRRARFDPTQLRFASCCGMKPVARRNHGFDPNQARPHRARQWSAYCQTAAIAPNAGARAKFLQERGKR